MSYQDRLDRAFRNAPRLDITPNSRYVFFSDCHRGVGNNNDNFQKNSNYYYAALQYYYHHGFTYIEVGDGDELWENRKMSSIIEKNEDIFSLLHSYHKTNRLYMLYGNHDIIKKYFPPLFDNMKVHEGIILTTEPSVRNLYVTHGHQADFVNSVLWRLSRFLVRYLWAPLERIGILDPTSASKNNPKKEKLEKKYINYALEKDCLLLTGHTHRPLLGNELSPYYNCGCQVNPRHITCIELCGYDISLVKWHAGTNPEHYYTSAEYPVYIKREVIFTQKIKPNVTI